jgi:hypothetical protein
MLIDTSTTKFNFKAQLDSAAKQRQFCARFECYGPPSTNDAQQCQLLHAELFNQNNVFKAMDTMFHNHDAQQPISTQLGHVLIYVFDGRDGTSKFHANMWKPIMGRDLVHLEYFNAGDPDPYLPFIKDALARQSAALKVSTVVNQAFAKVRQAKAVGLQLDVPLEAHKLLLHDSLMRLRHTDPLIYFHPSKRNDEPHFNRKSLVEHLCIYDRNPTWNL